MSAPAQPETATMETVAVASRLFGPLRVLVDDIIRMPEGMLGFAGERRFVMLPAAPEGVFWLQSVDEGGLIFLLVDPFLFFPDYVVDSPDVPEPGPDETVGVLSIVTLPKSAGEPCTVNLQGPLIIQTPAREARQVILADPKYNTRHSFDLRSRLA